MAASPNRSAIQHILAEALSDLRIDFVIQIKLLEPYSEFGISPLMGAAGRLREFITVILMFF